MGFAAPLGADAHINLLCVALEELRRAIGRAIDINQQLDVRIVRLERKQVLNLAFDDACLVVSANADRAARRRRSLPGQLEPGRIAPPSHGEQRQWIERERVDRGEPEQHSEHTEQRRHAGPAHAADASRVTGGTRGRARAPPLPVHTRRLSASPWAKGV